MAVSSSTDYPLYEGERFAERLVAVRMEKLGRMCGSGWWWCVTGVLYDLSMRILTARAS
jgi:hypothetical protein